MPAYNVSGSGALRPPPKSRRRSCFGSGALRPPPKSRRRSCFGSGALRPPPPVAAALVPRCALLPAATPRDVLTAVGTWLCADASAREPLRRVASPFCTGIGKLRSGRSLIMRGVGAGRSAQRGTSAAATGPRGARSAPPNPELDLAHGIRRKTDDHVAPDRPQGAALGDVRARPARAAVRRPHRLLRGAEGLYDAGPRLRPAHAAGEKFESRRHS